MKNVKSKTKSAGFTLIELMLSMAILAILTASMTQIARFTDTQKNLTLAADQVRVAIRTAQGYALSIPEVSTTSRICGFGFYADSTTSYKIFYNPAADIATCASRTGYNGSYSINITNETRSLPEGVTFNSSGSANAVYFKAPYGDVATARSYQINGGGSSRAVSVNSQGMIN